jgi:TATA-box binding protein (TBP) (component of TFIID and TFIIIB)
MDGNTQVIFENQKEDEGEVKLNLPDFETISVSTKTFIIRTNIVVDIQKLFELLPLTNYVVMPKKRGRKKKTILNEINKDIPDGSIIHLSLRDDVKGADLRKKKKDQNENKNMPNYFRNSVTVVMMIDGKKVNFKISKNGTIQMTGCKTDWQAEQCVRYIWEYIKDHQDVYTIAPNQPFRAIFIPAMRNVDFSLGFELDREKLDEYFNNCTDHYSALDTSVGYTGVVLKFKLKKPITDLNIKELSYRGNKWLSPKYVTYAKYLDTLKPRERQKKLEKPRYTTILCFYSGKTILSSMNEVYGKEAYDEFVQIITNNYNTFKQTSLQ